MRPISTILVRNTGKMIGVLAVLLVLSACSYTLVLASGGCRLTNRNDRNMDVFWLNLERSTERRYFMTSQLNFYGLESKNRVNALTPHSIFIPDELSSSIECVSLINQTLPNFPELHSPANTTDPRAMLLTHCGRKKNRRREIAVTVSHLNTIRRAIYEGNASHPYALILEDDLQFAADIDFQDLIASAPANFGVLQLVTSNDYAVLELWRVYTRHKLQWVRRKDRDDYWCAGAYIINKAIFKPYIDSIMPPMENNWFGVHLIAGYEKPECTPSICCEKGVFKTDHICIRSARGYASDNYLYNIPYGNAYMLTVPIVTGGVFGNQSTLHQDHVSFHVSAFHRINSLVEEMRTGVSHMPSFMNKYCMFNRSAVHH